MTVPRNISAGFSPSRSGPPRSEVPVSTKGLFPRDYRRRLREGERDWLELSEFDSTTVAFHRPSPIIGTAMHYNSRIRKDLQPKFTLADPARYYEEDPHTEKFLGLFPHTLTPNQSRFEFDCNRPPDTTIYETPELAWGLNVWKEPLDQFEKEFTLEKWYEFHTMMDVAVEHAIDTYGFAVVFDFHSYNYQRSGKTDWATDGKPVINLGTRHLQIDERGERIVKQFLQSCKGHTIDGKDLLVEENGVFYGGYLNRRLAHLFGSKVITLSVEYKKVYMDEQTGELLPHIMDQLVDQMDNSISELAEALDAPLRSERAYPFILPKSRA